MNNSFGFVLLKKLHRNARLPERKYQSAGYDLFPINEGCIVQGKRAIIDLGFATEFDPGWVALIFDRGGMGIKGMIRLAGVIDSDYRGEWKVVLHNLSETDHYYGPDKAIAQVLFMPFFAPIMNWVPDGEELALTERDKQMSGSSDGRVIEVGLGFSGRGGMSGI